jgi:tRNA(Ile)-lysidine synthase
MASSRNSLSIEVFESVVRNSLQRLIPSGARVAIALSGGLDSRVLLALAAQYATPDAYSLSAVHIHHGLNPKADQWAAFCGEICQELNIPLSTIKVDIPRDTNDGLESAARRLRYSRFAELNVDYVLLAHHRNDQAETLLLNLLRGAGVKGAAAMQAVSGKAGRYLRPMLDVTRSELEAYANEKGLTWVEDDSNGDSRFTRNYLRLNVMPALKARFPSAVENLGRAAENFAEAQQMLDEMAIHDLAHQAATFPVPVALLGNLTTARAMNVLRYLLGQADLQAPSAVRMKEALRQFLEAAPDRHPHLDLPSYRLFRQKGWIQLEIYSS